MYLDARRLSLGLLDGATDIIGGDPLQEPVEKDFTSDANGHILIPAADGGGVVTWIRGVWDYGTQFRYNDFMAGTEDPNATNYAAPDSAAVCTNLYEGGIYFTRLEPVGTAPNTQYHVRYSRRSGQTVGKGSPINGWPYNYVDPVYLGTAVDGDMYVMWACEMAFAAFGEPKYRNLARYIGNANKAAGAWQGNRIDFNLPYSAEAGEVGVYEYNGVNTPFAATRVARLDQPGYCLKIDTTVLDGGTPANYAGWGVWPTWNITEQEPFNSIDFEFDGGGVGRNIELSTNARDDDPTAEVAVLIPCLSTQGGVFTPYSITPDDFWRLHNVVLEYRHKEAYWTSESALSQFTRTELADGIALAYQFNFNPTTVYGPELVQNGDFSSPLTDPPWRNSSGGSGTVTLVGSQAQLTHTDSGNPRARLRQEIITEAGATYAISFSCSGFSGPEAFVDVGTTAGGSNIRSNVICGNGVNTFGVVAPGTSMWLNFYSTTAGVVYVLDNVSCKKVVSAAQTASGDIGINPAECDSTGTAVLHLDLKPTASGTLRVSVRGSNSVTYSQDIAITANTRADHALTWASFGAVQHPINMITLKPVDHGVGAYTLYGLWYDTVETMADMEITAIGGLEFQFPSHSAEEAPYSCKFANVVLNVSIHDPYPVLPRWTYKWTMGSAGYIGYGTWRGWSAPGYLWTGGWTLLDPPMATLIRQFMTDAQVEYQSRFGGLPGPFMPRYGRAAWEALNQEGVVDSAGVFTSNTYNKWYFPWDDSLTDVSLSGDWYGYTYRALLSCAADYYLSPTSQMHTILNNWVEWFMQGERSLTDTITWDSRRSGTYANGDDVLGLIWDEDHWHPPSEFVANGTVRYHYNPTYSYACIAQAMLFKYWVEGDPLAYLSYLRLVDYLNAQQLLANGTTSIKIREADDSGDCYVSAGPGSLVVVQRGEEGSGYTTATVTVTGDGTGAAIVPRIFGGRIRYYEILNIGSGYTHIEATVSGDGTGATVCLALYDQLVGAFDLYHTGWEIWEIYNLYAMVVLGHVPGGTVNYPVTPRQSEVTALANLEAFFVRNRKDTYPMMQLANYLPMHEFGGWDPYHNGSGIENPMIRDSRTRGKLWTETTGPAMRAGVFYRLLHP